MEFLERARALARAGWGHVHPNPMVGCLLVREGRVVGEGYHERFGGPHAETLALASAGSEARGATVYVTLEPCDHHGKTPPCSEALVRAGVARVVYGAREPGPEAAGGARTLRDAGVEVTGPVWGEEAARAENPVFFHTTREATPFVALKLAMTLDGRIAAGPGRRTRITGEEAEREVHRLRSGFDAVLVGSGTVRADDPRLTVRHAPAGHRPLRRVVLDSHASLPAYAALLSGDPSVSPVHVFTREDVSEAEIERLEAAGAHVHPVPGSEEGVVFPRVLETLWDLGVRSVLCEGGRRVADGLLRGGRVNRLYLFIAPHTLGAEGLAALADDAGRLDWTPFRPAAAPVLFGRDALLVYDRVPA